MHPPTHGPSYDYDPGEPKGIHNEIDLLIYKERGYLWNLVNAAFLLLDMLNIEENLVPWFDSFVEKLSEEFKSENISRDHVKANLWKYFSAVCIWTDELLEPHVHKKYNSEGFNAFKAIYSSDSALKGTESISGEELSRLGCECLFFRKFENRFKSKFLVNLSWRVLKITFDSGCFFEPVVYFKYSYVVDYLCCITGFTVRPCAAFAALDIFKMAVNFLFDRNEVLIPGNNDRVWEDGNIIQLRNVKTPEVSNWLDDMCGKLSANFTKDGRGWYKIKREGSQYLGYTVNGFCDLQADRKPKFTPAEILRTSVNKMHAQHTNPGAVLVGAESTRSNYTTLLERLDLLLNII